MTDANSIKTLLVVDDSRVSRMMSRQFILNLHPDWIIEEAVSGEEAIAKLDAITPDLIVLDINMPGMGGLAAVQKLREKRPAARICLMTANVQDAIRAKARALGVDFAAKPITETSIRQIISVIETA